jgi:hypothetical protein
MNAKRIALFSLLLAGLGVTSALAASVTPEGVKGIFDANAMFIMFVWGIIHKHVPALGKLDNALIPWFNTVGYVLAQLGGAAVAHAQALPAAAGVVSTLPNIFGILLGGVTNSVLAKLIYDTYGKTLLCKWLRIPVPQTV